MKEMETPALLPVRLDLFDGAGTGGDGGGAAAGGAGAAGAGAQAGAGRDHGTGKQAAPGGESRPEGKTQPQVQTSSDTLEDRQRRYRELVSGEFRDLYDEDAQRLVSRSAREAAALREQAARVQPVLDMLMERYKLRGGDLDKLQAALENDSAYWSQAAEEAGMSVEQYKQLQKLQRENAQLLRAQRERIGQERADAQLQKWYGEAEAMKGLYPGFNLSAEVRNPQFISMLRAGVPVQQAYEVLHMDEIKAGIAAMQARATEQQVVANVRAKGARPQENGTSAGAGFAMKDDVHRLTPKERAELAKRAARGEVITF